MKTSGEVIYNLEDVTAAADAAFTLSYQAPWVEPSELVREITLKNWHTLEDHGTLLDGEHLLFSDTPEAETMGFWSFNLSDENGRYSGYIPFIHVDFTKPHTSRGISLTGWVPSDEWCSEVSVKWVNSTGQELSNMTFYPDSVTYFCENYVENYYGVDIWIRKINRPYSFAKVSHLAFGQELSFTGSTLLSGTVLEEIDPLSDTVSINTFEMTAWAPEFDPLAPGGAYQSFQQQQRIRPRLTIDGTQMACGTFYMDEVSYSDGILSIKAVDALGIANGTTFLGGLYNNATAADVLAAWAVSAGVKIEVASSLQNTPLNGYIPVCGHRDALQMIALAIGGMVDCSRDGIVRVLSLPTTASAALTPADKVIGHTVTQSAPVTGVEVYTVTRTLNETDYENLFVGELTAGQHLIKFERPADDLHVSANLTIVSSGPNHAVVNCTAAGSATIIGYVYDEVTSLAGSYYVNPLPAGYSENIVRVNSLTLWSDPSYMAKRIYDWYQHRITETGDLLPGSHTVGSLVIVKTKGKTDLVGVITSLRYNIADGAIRTVEIRGG